MKFKTSSIPKKSSGMFQLKFSTLSFSLQSTIHVQTCTCGVCVCVCVCVSLASSP